MLQENKNKELDALISLLDEPDKDIYTHIRDRIFSYGVEAIPFLEDAWEHSFDSLIQERIENIIHQIQLDNLYGELHNWAHFGYDDLLKGAIIISKFQYPDLDEDTVIKQIGRISQDIWLELNQDLTALEKIKVINHILYDIDKFTGNLANPKAPENYYINNLLDTKKGNPLSLGILYIILARSLKIPISGVDLPKHFILAYVSQPEKVTKSGSNKEKVLFYINPFNKGALFTENEIELYIKQMVLTPRPSFFAPCDNVTVIRRMINELKDCYEKAGSSEKVEELKVLIKALE